jgi:hypothetical protein
MVDKSLKNMNNKFYITILIFFLITISVSAQKTDTLALLQNKIWTIEIPSTNIKTHNNKHLTKGFAADFIFEKNHNNSNGTYYLSDTPEPSFNVHKIGKQKCGKFIVVNSRKKDNMGKITIEVSNYKILKLTQDTLKIQYMPTSMIIDN